jgi:hypothetical protein
MGIPLRGFAGIVGPGPRTPPKRLYDQQKRRVTSRLRSARLHTAHQEERRWPFDFVYSYTDATFSGGGVGLISLGAPGQFDNVRLVPEPASAGLLGAGMLLIRRRNRRD